MKSYGIVLASAFAAMIIAIAASGRWLDSLVDCHTGRAVAFVLYDTEQETFDVIENMQGAQHMHWVGATSARELVNAGAEVIIVSRIGPCAFRILSEAGIEVFFAEEDTDVTSAIRWFREGKLPLADGPNCDGHLHHAASVVN